MQENCTRCLWYAEFEGVCCNGDSPFCADTPPFPKDIACRYWEDNKHDRVAGAAAAGGAGQDDY